jgi:nucleotide-binding universal stress UspA family protein
MKTIIALVDFTAASSKVLDYAQTLATALGSQLILMHVVPFEIPVAAYGAADIAPIPLPISSETIRAEQTRLDDLLRSLTQRGVNASAIQFTGPLAETVLNQATQAHADLVIMGSHHHSALYNLFIGSVTADVLKRATFPVFVVPCDPPTT